MTENTRTSVLISSQELKNGIHVNFYNISKKIVGDRWQVKVKCDAVCVLNDDLFASIPAEDIDFIEGMRAKYSEGIIYTITKDRNFVDDADMEEVLGQILDQLSSNVVEYLSSEKFPEKLFDQKFKEWKQEYTVKKEMGLLEDVEDDDGPADFSACFSD